MAEDQPLIFGPYANIPSIPSYNATNPIPTNKKGTGTTPTGHMLDKVAQAQLALQGLIGARI